jgi:predicted lipoprotein with Yx(FWY)xxD motif
MGLLSPAPAFAATSPHHKVEVEIARAKPLGQVLVDGSHQVLYIDTRDRANHSVCTGACAKVWQPLVLPKGVKVATAGPGVKALGTFHRTGTQLQVTSHKMPLYLYVGDRRAGQHHGQGLMGTWFVATPTGSHPQPAVAPTTTTPTTTPAGATPTTGAVPTTSPVRSGSTTGGGSPTTRPPTSPPATAPPATAPPATAPPATSPPATSPPATSPPATSPPTTVPGGGVAY